MVLVWYGVKGASSVIYRCRALIILIRWGRGSQAALIIRPRELQTSRTASAYTTLSAVRTCSQLGNRHRHIPILRALDDTPSCLVVTIRTMHMSRDHASPIPPFYQRLQDQNLQQTPLHFFKYTICNSRRIRGLGCTNAHDGNKNNARRLDAKDLETLGVGRATLGMPLACSVRNGGDGLDMELELTMGY